MNWTNKIAKEVKWCRDITNRESKEKVAAILAKKLKAGDTVGVGSGSTSFLTLIALADRRDQEGLDFSAITTSIEMELACMALLVPSTSLVNRRPDWSFDGADEVDSKGSLIKGRGGALLREKLLMQASPKIYIVVDKSKYVDHLGEKFPVPVEIHPEAIHVVETALQKLKKVEAVSLRQAVAKDGPVITENGNLILDVKFSSIDDQMEKELKSIVGVVESGLFIGYKVNLIQSDNDKLH